MSYSTKEFFLMISFLFDFRIQKIPMTKYVEKYDRMIHYIFYRMRKKVKQMMIQIRNYQIQNENGM
jgi:hypothetical protein